MLIQESASHIQHMQKALSQMNLQLHNAITDITGDTGIKIIRAIISGERDAKTLAAYRDRRCKNSLEIIEKSLTGNYRDEHIFSLTQAVELYDIYMEKIMACDRKIEQQLSVFEDRSVITEPKSLEQKESVTKKKQRSHCKNKTIVRCTIFSNPNSWSGFNRGRCFFTSFKIQIGRTKSYHRDST